MKALVWHGKEDIRHDTVPDPEIEDDTDAIIDLGAQAHPGQAARLW